MHLQRDGTHTWRKAIENKGLVLVLNNVFDKCLQTTLLEKEHLPLFGSWNSSSRAAKAVCVGMEPNIFLLPNLLYQ